MQLSLGIVYFYNSSRYDGVCDKSGCDYHSYRLGNKDYYGKGQDFDINTEQEVTVVTQFITDDNTDNGNLVEVRRFYIQNGQTIENSKPEFDLGQLAEFDSITDEFCAEAMNLYGDYNDHEKKGGLKVNSIHVFKPISCFSRQSHGPMLTYAH